MIVSNSNILFPGTLYLSSVKFHNIWQMFSIIHDILNITYYITCMIPINLYLLHVSIQRLEKEMATHSSILAWRISWTEEPGGLQAMKLQRVGHN